MFGVWYYCKIAIIVLILFFNGIVILTFCVMGKPLRGNSSNIFFFNQAIADCTVSAPILMHVLPINILQLWQAELYIFTYSVFVSIGSIMINVLDRFLTLKKTFRHCRFVTWLGVLKAILGAWSCPLIPVFMCAVSTNNLDKNWYCTMLTFPCMLLIVIIVLVLLFVSLAVIKLSSRKQMNDIQSQPLNESNEDTFHIEYSKERGMVHLMLTMAFVYAITILPYMIIELVNKADLSNPYPISGEAIGATYLLYTLSAVINPLLTLCLKQDFNQALRRYLRRRSNQELQMETVTASTEM